MADMTHQGAPTTGRTQRGPAHPDQGAGPTLHGLSVAPHFSEEPVRHAPINTRASVESRWGARYYGTGLVMQGEVVGRKG
jgi:hypothetical protein